MACQTQQDQQKDCERKKKLNRQTATASFTRGIGAAHYVLLVSITVAGSPYPRSSLGGVQRFVHVTITPESEAQTQNSALEPKSPDEFDWPSQLWKLEGKRQKYGGGWLRARAARRGGTDYDGYRREVATIVPLPPHSLGLHLRSRIGAP